MIIAYGIFIISLCLLLLTLTILIIKLNEKASFTWNYWFPVGYFLITLISAQYIWG